MIARTAHLERLVLEAPHLLLQRRDLALQRCLKLVPLRRDVQQLPLGGHCACFGQLYVLGGQLQRQEPRSVLVTLLQSWRSTRKHL